MAFWSANNKGPVEREIEKSPPPKRSTQFPRRTVLPGIFFEYSICPGRAHAKPVNCRYIRGC
jgi:hypothetical protein